jgi:hypothetical protein
VSSLPAVCVAVCAPRCRCQARYHFISLHSTFRPECLETRARHGFLSTQAPASCSPAPAVGFFRLLQPAFVCASARADALRLYPHNTLAWLARRRGAGCRAAAFATSRPSTSQPAGADSDPPANHPARLLSDHRAIPSASPKPQGGGPLAASQLTFRAIERPFATRLMLTRVPPLRFFVRCQRVRVLPNGGDPLAHRAYPKRPQRWVATSKSAIRAGIRRRCGLHPANHDVDPRLADAPQSGHWHKRNTHFRPVQAQSRSRLCLAERGTWIAYHLDPCFCR